MKESALPLPVSNIKQEPYDDFFVTQSKTKLQQGPLGQECGGSRDNTPPSGEAACQPGGLASTSSLERLNNDRSEQLSNSSDSGDVIIREGESEVGSKSDFKYECPICQARFKSARAFRGHGIVHRFGAAPELRTRLPPMDVAQCTLQYSPKRLGFESSSFKCDGCQTIFNSRDTYAMHMLMRAKDENCGALTADTKPRHLLDDGLDRGDVGDSHLKNPDALRQGLWNLQMLQKSRAEGKVFDYQPVIPDLIPSPGGSRDLIVCRICGEIFQSKDSLAMHMMFHTRTEAENSRRGWTVIYASAMSDLTENPEDLISNHELIPIEDTLPESLDGVAQVPNDVELPYSEGVSDDPCYSDEANEGLDLSISSRTKDGNMEGEGERSISKTPNIFTGHGNKAATPGMNSHCSEDITDLTTVPSEVRDRLFCFKYDPPKTPPTLLRSQSADLNASRKMNSDVNGDETDINIIRCLTENPARVPRAENETVEYNTIHNHVRSKSADVVMHRHDRQLTSSILGKIRKLRKARVPTRKYPFRTPHRFTRPPEVRKEPEVTKSPEVIDSSCMEGDKSIAELLSTKGKDLSYCKYCEIIYLDRTLFQLHMGLHNVNNPWQCNACGRICSNRLEFSSHVLHY